MPVYVDVHGPIFNGMAEAELKVMMRDVVEAVTAQGVDDIHAHLPGVLQHPTGTYEASVVGTVPRTRGRIFSDLVYSAWLEGTSRRNQSTRFKGYHTFRIIAAQLRAGGAAVVASRIVAERIGRLS